MTAIAVVGSGYMGGGIAQLFALAGHAVTIADVSGEVARGNRDRLLTEAAQFAADGLFPTDAAETIGAHLVAAETIEDAVASADLVIEAVPEVLEIKHEILGRVSRAAPDATIATNTSTISIAAIAAGVERPERFLGVHFSNPAPFIPGVEIIPHEGTDLALLPGVEALVQGIGKETARVADVTGFVLNRLQYALFHEATQLLDEGVATAEDIDTIVRTTFGYRLPFFGPFAIADMAGLDVYRFCYASLQTSFPERFATPPSLAALVEAGHLGTKSGGGYREIAAERTPELIAYRNKAYARMAEVLDELGPPPLG